MLKEKIKEKNQIWARGGEHEPARRRQDQQPTIISGAPAKQQWRRK
jgi:hypothetical protein